MARRSLLIFTIVYCWTNGATWATAQGPLGQAWVRGTGGYLAWWKLLVLIVGFLAWVKLTDWINTDGMKIGDASGLPPEVWNPISIGSFLLGFIAALAVPIFWIGMPVYLLSVSTPFLIYVLLRRGKKKANPRLDLILKAEPGEPILEPLPQDKGAPVQFRAAGAGEQSQANLIRARQTPAFVLLKDLVVDCLGNRTETLMLDYTRDQVRAQILIDGQWHRLDPMDRETGDALLYSLKSLANLNPADRRSRQLGRFTTILDEKKTELELLTQGTPTGERAQLKFLTQKAADMSLVQLGMWPDVAKKFTDRLNQTGLIIVSAPPHQGLTTTWRSSLLAADRITRDWIGIGDGQDEDVAVENVQMNLFDRAAGESPATIMRKLMLTQPDGVAVPDPVNSQSLDLLCHEIVHQQRTVMTQVVARNAAEALLRLYAMAGDKKLFLQAVTAATGQRLARRLCDNCKQPVTVQPKLIQQLGGDPRRQNTIYNPYRLPPPEKRVDEQGKPIDIPPCPVCSGFGYIGRIGIFEMIAVDDSIRNVLAQQPQVPAIQQIAQQTGNESMLAAGYKLVLLGITSINEVQRAMKT